jgi:hypothetical protein
MRQSAKADGSAQAQQARDVTRRAKAACIFSVKCARNFPTWVCLKTDEHGIYPSNVHFIAF